MEIWLHIQIFTLYLFLPMCLQTAACWINLQGIPSGRQHQSEVSREEVVSCRTLGFTSYISKNILQIFFAILCSTYYVSGIVLCVLHLSAHVFLAMFGSRYSYSSQFTDGETEA